MGTEKKLAYPPTYGMNCNKKVYKIPDKILRNIYIDDVVNFRSAFTSKGFLESGYTCFKCLF